MIGSNTNPFMLTAGLYDRLALIKCFLDPLARELLDPNARLEDG